MYMGPPSNWQAYVGMFNLILGMEAGRIRRSIQTRFSLYRSGLGGCSLIRYGTSMLYPTST